MILVYFPVQFYKDTLKDEPSPEKEIKKERSPSPVEMAEGDIKTEDIKQEIKTEDDIKMETDPGRWIMIKRPYNILQYFTAVQMPIFDYFHIFAQNINCGYTLEPPQMRQF